MLRSLSALLPASALLAFAAAPATGLTIGFEEFDHGDVVAASQGVIINADNFNRAFDLAVAFDSTVSNSADPDLQIGSGWSAGNLPSDTALGNLLILQENNSGCAGGSGTCSDPDDEGDRPAGELEFILPAVFVGFSFDLVDVEGDAEDGTIQFFLGGSPVPSMAFMFSDFETWGQGVVYGDNSANHVDFAGHLEMPYDRVVITMAGSGGVDNLTFVPEPGAGALLGLGLVGLSQRARTRRRA